MAGLGSSRSPGWGVAVDERRAAAVAGGGVGCGLHVHGAGVGLAGPRAGHHGSDGVVEHGLAGAVVFELVGIVRAVAGPGVVRLCRRGRVRVGNGRHRHGAVGGRVGSHSVRRKAGRGRSTGIADIKVAGLAEEGGFARLHLRSTQ